MTDTVAIGSDNERRVTVPWSRARSGVSVALVVLASVAMLVGGLTLYAREEATVALTSTAAPPVSVRKKSRTGASRLRIQAVRPAKGAEMAVVVAASVESAMS